MTSFQLTLSLERDRLKLACSGPSAWSELTDRQAVALMRLRAQVNQKSEVLFPALTLLYGLKPRHQRWLFDADFLRKKGLDEESMLMLLEHGQTLLDSLRWIGEIDPDAGFPRRFRRFDYHYGTPRIWLRRLRNRQVYAGPQPGLADCTFEEFMFADKAYREGDLPLLAAILCRESTEPARTFGNLLRSEPRLVRRPFDRKTAEARANVFADLDPALLARIAFGFGCTMLNLQQTFRFVFAPTEEPGAGPTAQPTGNWLEVAINMAKFDVTKIRDIEQINLYLALKVLNEQLRQAEVMDAEIEKMKSRSS